MSKIRFVLGSVSVGLLVAGSSDQPHSTIAPAAILAAKDVARNGTAELAPRLPTPPDLSTAEGRTEAALIDQLSCRKFPEAAKAINAMLLNGLVRETDDGGDGSLVYVPTRPLFVFGFPLVRVTGWQMKRNSGDGEPPFFRGPGLPPPNFISVTVRARPEQVRSAAKALNIREDAYEVDPRQDPVDPIQIRRQIPGIQIEAGDMSSASSQMSGVSTLSCVTNHRW